MFSVCIIEISHKLNYLVNKLIKIVASEENLVNFAS